MSKRFLFGCMIIAIIVFSVVAYQVGFSSGYGQASGSLRVTFVTELTALQEIRAKKYNLAISRLESHCYSTAVTLLQSPIWHDCFTVKIFMPVLRSYRFSNAHDSISWTPTEKTLEALLKNRGTSGVSISEKIRDTQKVVSDCK